jgi:hypothetical protein
MRRATQTKDVDLMIASTTTLIEKARALPIDLAFINRKLEKTRARYAPHSAGEALDACLARAEAKRDAGAVDDANVALNECRRMASVAERAAEP